MYTYTQRYFRLKPMDEQQKTKMQQNEQVRQQNLELRVQNVFRRLNKKTKTKKEPILCLFGQSCLEEDIEQVQVVQWLIFQGLEHIGKT
jgi:hypothetical protein